MQFARVISKQAPKAHRTQESIRLRDPETDIINAIRSNSFGGGGRRPKPSVPPCAR